VNASLAREPGVSAHVVLDNYATHKTAAVKRWFLRHPEYHLHFIPTSSSWLNQVERFFARITEPRIRRGVFTSVPQRERAIADYLAEHNQNPKPFVWAGTADSILERLKRACERTSDSGHYRYAGPFDLVDFRERAGIGKCRSKGPRSARSRSNGNFCSVTA